MKYQIKYKLKDGKIRHWGTFYSSIEAMEAKWACEKKIGGEVWIAEKY